MEASIADRLSQSNLEIAAPQPRCGDCGMVVSDVFDHVDGCPSEDYLASMTMVYSGQELLGEVVDAG